MRGVSILDSVTAEGPQLFGGRGGQGLFEAIKANVRKDIPVHELDVNVNDAEFAPATSGALWRC